jgi:polyphosphate kinase
VFEYIEYPYRRYKFNHLLVSPINSRRQLYRLIDNELANAKAGQPSGITSRSTTWWTETSSTGSMPPARPGCPSR